MEGVEVLGVEGMLSVEGVEVLGVEGVLGAGVEGVEGVEVLGVEWRCWVWRVCWV